MDKNNIKGTAQIMGGTYVGYQALQHGLPRAFGIRIEYHTTSKQNAKLIKQSGNILDPSYGGKNGLGQKINSKTFVDTSQNYVHITGLHKDSKLFNNNYFKKLKSKKVPIRTLGRIRDNLMYKIIGSGCVNNVEHFRGSKLSFLDKVKLALKRIMYAEFHSKTTRFCIPGIDSYFNSEFISDPHDYLALKTNQPVKVYNNRFSAMLAGLKKFGLKGIKENKSRVIAGASIVTGGLYVGAKLINKGFKDINKNIS